MKADTLHKRPVVSVILPVYNSEKYVKAAIDSILKQTFTELELIIINDGSTDNSASIIQSFKNERIIYIEQKNIGLAATLNKGIETASGEFIARQDADDISLPDRLQHQLDFFKKYESVALLGTAAEIINEQGSRTNRFHRHPVNNNVLKFYLVFDNPFVHSSVMFRKKAIEEIGNYTNDSSVFEDHNLWSRMARKYNVANLPLSFLQYREVESGISKSTSDYSTRVKNQCVENIKFYCPLLSDEKINRFVTALFGLDIYQNYEEPLALVTSTLKEIAAAYSAQEKIDLQEIEPVIAKQILIFRRAYYQQILNSENKNYFTKLKAKVNRKLMFMNHKKKLR